MTLGRVLRPECLWVIDAESMSSEILCSEVSNVVHLYLAPILFEISEESSERTVKDKMQSITNLGPPNSVGAFEV